MKNKTTLAILAITLLAFTACAPTPEQLRSCKTDNDCTLVKANDCCTCDTTMNARYAGQFKGDYRETHPDQCGNVLCEPCAIITKAACENGQCVMKG